MKKILIVVLLLFSAASFAQAQDQLETAKKKLAAGDFTGAKADLSKILEATPKNKIALNLRGQARAGLDDLYGAIGDCAPAFGMVGTLIGMVQMFANMTDPSKLGPFMAVALLATLYGAAVANLFCLPIADKLHVKLADEEVNRTLIIDGILMLREAKSPQIVREMLLAYLPEAGQKHAAAEAETVPA